MYTYLGLDPSDAEVEALVLLEGVRGWMDCSVALWDVIPTISIADDQRNWWITHFHKYEALPSCLALLELECSSRWKSANFEVEVQ